MKISLPQIFMSFLKECIDASFCSLKPSYSYATGILLGRKRNEKFGVHCIYEDKQKYRGSSNKIDFSGQIMRNNVESNVCVFNGVCESYQKELLPVSIRAYGGRFN